MVSRALEAVRVRRSPEGYSALRVAVCEWGSRAQVCYDLNAVAAVVRLGFDDPFPDWVQAVEACRLLQALPSCPPTHQLVSRACEEVFVRFADDKCALPHLLQLALVMDDRGDETLEPFFLRVLRVHGTDPPVLRAASDGLRRCKGAVRDEFLTILEGMVASGATNLGCVHLHDDKELEAAKADPGAELWTHAGRTALLAKDFIQCSRGQSPAAYGFLLVFAQFCPDAGAVRAMLPCADCVAIMEAAAAAGPLWVLSWALPIALSVLIHRSVWPGFDEAGAMATLVARAAAALAPADRARHMDLVLLLGNRLLANRRGGPDLRWQWLPIHGEDLRTWWDLVSCVWTWPWDLYADPDSFSARIVWFCMCLWQDCDPGNTFWRGITGDADADLGWTLDTIRGCADVTHVVSALMVLCNTAWSFAAIEDRVVEALAAAMDAFGTQPCVLRCIAPVLTCAFPDDFHNPAFTIRLVKAVGAVSPPLDLCAVKHLQYMLARSVNDGDRVLREAQADAVLDYLWPVLVEEDQGHLDFYAWLYAAATIMDPWTNDALASRVLGVIHVGLSRHWTNPETLCTLLRGINNSASIDALDLGRVLEVCRRGVSPHMHNTPAAREYLSLVWRPLLGHSHGHPHATAHLRAYVALIDPVIDAANEVARRHDALSVYGAARGFFCHVMPWATPAQGAAMFRCLLDVLPKIPRPLEDYPNDLIEFVRFTAEDLDVLEVAVEGCNHAALQAAFATHKVSASHCAVVLVFLCSRPPVLQLSGMHCVVALLTGECGRAVERPPSSLVRSGCL